MLTIDITLKGNYASGKTRATEAIKRVLAFDVPDKEYVVNWTHVLPNGEITEQGSFESEES